MRNYCRRLIRALGFLVLFLAVGAGYGFLGAFFNSNPYWEPYEGAAEKTVKQPEAWNWKPSPVWLTSYALCTWSSNGIYISYTRSGYLFRTPGDKARYYSASVTIGVMAAVVLYCVFILVWPYRVPDSA